MSANPVADISEAVDRAIQGHQRDPLALLQILREVQDEYSYVPEEAIFQIAEELALPRTQVEGVIEFYAFLHRKPRGQYDILLSDSITDHMLGKQELMDYWCQRLEVTPGQTRADGRVSVDNTACTGMCDQGPAGLINGLTVTQLTPQRIDAMVNLINARVPLGQWPREFFAVHDNVRRRDLILTEDFTKGTALQAVLNQGADAILGELDKSGLRGLGGAGFRTASKWNFCRNARGSERFVVCNADEGEPGTFKDRVLLQSHADLLFEGMTLCARVIGAQHGYLYLRGEYRYLLEALEEILQRRRQAGLLGNRIMGIPDFSFDIQIHLGAGAYICGEESALIESLEGKRGIARVRPPFPVTEGFLRKPTVVNNVETFCCAAKIAVHSGIWFAAKGTEQSKGTKLLSISGDCERRGIYEYPFGVSIRDILEDCGAAEAQAVQIAGAAGHCIGPDEFHRQLGFEDLPTGGSFMVFGKDRDMLDMVRNFAHFFAHESCGFCTPCRVGTVLMRDLIDKIYAGHGTHFDLDELRNIGTVMQHTSNCGLGHTAPNPVFDTLQRFPQIYEGRLRSTSFEPAFDLDQALEEARQLTGRDDAGAHL